MKSIRNVIFDFGGVLYNIRYANVADAFGKYGVSDFGEIYSKTTQNGDIDLFEEGRISVPEFRRRLRTVIGKPLSDKQIDECWNAIMVGFPKEREDLLKKVRRHYRIFLYSNTNELNYRHFTAELKRQFGYDIFGTLFDRTYFSQLMHIRKPKEEGFLRIVAENRLTPSQTLFIDDSPQHIAAASRCGLNTYHIADGHTAEEAFDPEGRLKIKF